MLSPSLQSDAAKKDVALQSIPQFCFPDVDQWKPVKEYKSESFSFVLTDMEGGRRYGYCRRLLVSWFFMCMREREREREREGGGMEGGKGGKEGQKFILFPSLQPQDSGKRLPEVYCIVSPLGCFSLYEKVTYVTTFTILPLLLTTFT